MNNEELFKSSLNFVPGGVHSPVRSFKGLHTTPRFIKSADGAYLTDEENKNYIDFCMSFGPLILGHKNEEVHDKVISAISRGWSYGAAEKYSLELAEFIVSKIDFIDQIRFMNSGTEAVMTAIRLARGVTGKSKILKFDGCYHGHMDSMLIKAGSGLAGTAEASSKGVTKETADNTLICELGDLESCQKILESNNDIAAIFLEPLPANNGILVQDRKFIQGLRDLCDKHHVLLVFDEVISGFRVGFSGMAGDLGITPDIVTYGKVIGGGFPVGAVGARKEIMSSLAPLGDIYQAGTLSANPVAMVAGLTTLKFLTSDFYATLEEKSTKVTQLFKKWFKESEFSDYGLVQYKSLFWQAPQTDDVSASDITSPRLIPHNLVHRFKDLFKVLLEKGIYLSPNGYEIGFVSHAHDNAVLADLEKRLWS